MDGSTQSLIDNWRAQVAAARGHGIATQRIADAAAWRTADELIRRAHEGDPVAAQFVAVYFEDDPD